MARGNGDFAKNPAAKEQAGVMEESNARLGVLRRTYRATFDLEASAYARDTGALTNGSTSGGWNGLGPNYFNIAAGLTVSFPLLSMPSIRAQEAQEEAIGRSAAATYRQASLIYRLNRTLRKLLSCKPEKLPPKPRRKPPMLGTDSSRPMHSIELV